MLHARISAVWPNRALICHGLGEINAGVLESINARKYLRPNHTAKRLITRIATAIVDVQGSNRSDDAILIERNLRVAERSLIAVGTRGHVLRARLHPLDRASPGFLGSQRADRHLRVTRDLDAEAATDIGGFHANAINMNVQVRSKELNRE